MVAVRGSTRISAISLVSIASAVVAFL